MYRAHLAETAEEEKRREKELDILLKAELEQQWAKRLSQWRIEREARRKLMDDVIKTRKQQIEEKCKHASVFPQAGWCTHFKSISCITIRYHFIGGA